MKKKILQILLEIIFLVVYSLILYLMTYIQMIPENVQALINIMPTKFKYIFAGYIITLTLFILLRSIVKDTLKTNIICTIISIIITTISYYKLLALNLPFVPTDILLIGNLNQISEFGINSFPIHIVATTFVLIIILLIQYMIKRIYYTKRKMSLKQDWYRIPLFIIGIVLFYIFCISPNRFNYFNIKNDLGNNTSWMGENATFFIHLGDFYYKKPNEYNKEKFDELEEKYNDTKELEDTDIHPNIIIIMNESFSDPNKIKGVTYSVDPLHDIKELSINDKNCIIGETLSPVLGGGTSLPEYEVLTGLSSYYLSKQIFPYINYIRSDMNSIVRTCKNNEYKTIAIHPNTQTFYNRKNVYKYLGFEKSIFSEDIENPEIRGKYISDNELANQIIKEFEQNKDKKFIFGLTMQNHIPYYNKEYEYYDIDVNSNILTDDGKLNLRNYVQGIYDGEQMYMKLVNYLKEKNEPTILVMFGDHLPSLLEYKLYEYSEFKNEEYYKTPYFIWANYDIENKNIPNLISPSNLSISTLELANTRLPWYLNAFKQLYDKYPAINNQYVLNNENLIISSEIQKTDIINECEIIGYDLLIKKKYISIK